MALTILQDSRERKPWDFSKRFRVETVTFNSPDTGDYSIKGLEKVFRIERKGGGEIWSCVGSKKNRFQAQLDRLVQFPYRILVIEAAVSDLAKMKPRASITSWRNLSTRLIRWTASRGIPIWFLGKRSPESIHMVGDFIQGIHDHYTRNREFPKNWSMVTGEMK